VADPQSANLAGTLLIVNISKFEAVVAAVMDELPAWVGDEMDNVIVVVEPKPTRDQDPHNHGILGIYEGIPLTERSNDYFGVSPDRVVIFYEPHFALRLEESELISEIRTTVLHEIGHHLGLSDHRLHELGWG